MDRAPEQERLDIISEAVARLLKQQEETNRRLARLEAAVLPPAAVEPKVERTAEPVPIPPPLSLSEEPPKPEPKKPALETKVGLTLINRIGVVTLVLGVAFFFKWAVDNDWIGPAGRVAIGIAAGSAALALADFLWRKGQQTFAQGVTGTGIAVLYLAMYAAFAFYHLIPQALAFLCMFAATGMAVALSLRYEAQAIAGLGFLGAYATPLLLSTGEDRPWFLFSYVLLLNVAALALAKRRGWRVLEIGSFLATVAIYGVWLQDKFAKPDKRFVATLFLLAFYALYWPSSWRLLLAAQPLAALAGTVIWDASPGGFFALELAIAVAAMAYARLRKDPFALTVAFASFWLSYAVWTSGPEPLSNFAGISLAFLIFFAGNVWSQLSSVQTLWLVVLNGLVYYGAAYSLLDAHHHNWLGLLAVAVAAIYLAFGIYLFRKPSAQQDLRRVLLSLGAALCFLTLAIPVQFTGFTITIAWSLEAAALAWIGARLRNIRALFGVLIVFAFVFVRLVVIDSWMFSNGISYANSKPYALLANARFLTFAIAALSLFLAAWWTRSLSRRIALFEYFGGHLVLLWGLSMEIIGWAERSTRPENLLSVETVAISILFAIYAAILVSVGVATRTAVNRIAGLGLIGLVILKLYLFDIWQLERVYRISAFVALGILLIATSFLYSKFRNSIEGWWKDEETAP